MRLRRRGPLPGKKRGRRRDVASGREAGEGAAEDSHRRKRRCCRSRDRSETRADLQVDSLAAALHFLEEEHAVKESLSTGQTWCTPIPHERKVSTVRDFYKSFHDPSTLPILTCMVCYRKHTQQELSQVPWERWLRVKSVHSSAFSCCRCFRARENVSVCDECVRWLDRGGLSPAAKLHSRLGCEHVFPDELRDLTPIEEKLIGLNSCYGFVTRYNILGGQKQAARYPTHVKGHITVFPNNVQELVTKVLPHPLVKVMDEIHVSWQGTEKPMPSDISSLLSVRRRVVEKALLWLKKNNPLYCNVEIDVAEMESWGSSPHGVPLLVYDRMERNEPSAWERTRTAQVVPPAERAMDDEGAVEIEEILAALEGGGTFQDAWPHA